MTPWPSGGEDLPIGAGVVRAEAPWGEMVNAVILDPAATPSVEDARRSGCARLASSDELRFESVSHVGELATRLLDGNVEGRPDLVVIGPNVAEPVPVAETIRRRAGDVGVAILRPLATNHETREAIRFSPFLGTNVHCFPATEWQDCLPQLREMARRARERRRCETWNRQASDDLARVPPPRPVGPEAEMSALLESAPVAMVLVRSDGSVRSVNAEAARVLGRSARECAGEKLATVLPGFAEGAALRLVTEAAPGSVSRPRMVPEAGGLHRAFRLRASRPPSGDVVMLVIEDVTALKREDEKRYDQMFVEARRFFESTAFTNPPRRTRS